MRLFLLVFPSLLAVNYAIPLGVPGSPYARGVVVVFFFAVVGWALRQPARRVLRGWTRERISLVMIVVLLTGWGALSLSWSKDPATSIATVINLTIILAALLSFSILLNGRPELILPYCRGWLIAALLVVGTAGVELATGVKIPAPRSADVQQAVEDITGLTTTYFGNPNDMGVFLVASLPAVLFLLRWQRGGERVLAGAAVPLILIGTLASNARASSALLVVAIVAYFVLAEDLMPAAKALVVGLVALLVVGALAALPSLVEKIATLPASLSADHANSRVQLAIDGFDLLRATGGLGVGAGAFNSHLGNPQITYLGLWAFNPHNVYVEALTEFGLIVGSSFVVWMFWLGYRMVFAIGSPQRSILASGWICLVSIGIQSSSSLNSLVYFMLPLTLTSIAAAPPPEPTGHKPATVPASHAGTFPTPQRNGARRMRDFLAQVRRSWVVVVVAAGLGLLLAVAGTQVRPATYAAETQVRISWDLAGVDPKFVGAFDVLAGPTTRYASQAASADVLAPILAEQRARDTAETIVKSGRFRAQAIDGGLIIIQASASSADLATALTAGSAERVAAQANSDSYWNGRPRARVINTTVSEARAPIPDWALALVGAIAGAMVGLLILALRVALRPRVMSVPGLRSVVADRATVVGRCAVRPGSEPVTRAAAIVLDGLRSGRTGAVLSLIEPPQKSQITVTQSLADELRGLGRRVKVGADETAVAQVPVGAPEERGRVAAMGSAEFGSVVSHWRDGNDWTILPVQRDSPDKVAASLNYYADVALLVVVAGVTTANEVDDFLAEVPPQVTAALVLYQAGE
jgi:hypothetical protein